ncbi:hypothetical protein AVEN_231115-1 [Araneus ventricosus]|uniref:Uncharacterized protein n=1 Tax=Araneus ventricosus TaxID=182803 RepID=A0A4Y2J5S3_ARAVE|nr:hypothetical protein AVEN_231115-1 [Araneus ventricosus]
MRKEQRQNMLLKKKKTTAEIDLLHLKGEEETLKERSKSTQILLKKAEQSISDGLKLKSFADLECGQVFLTDSHNKISEITLFVENNKTEQMKKM